MTLSPEEADFLFSEATRASAQMPEGDMRDSLLALAAALPGMRLGEAGETVAQQLLEVGLQSGRIRHLYLAEGETIARRIYAKTPAGRRAASAAQQVNQALTALVGQRIDEVSVETPAPGHHTLSIETEGLRLRLRFSRSSVSLDSAEV